ncbi:CDT phosphatase transcription factor [Heliothis virescens ascovirus 3i]|nr:CDT phosphatase transcription factor [Heliothis virescens ascovirus 3i]
MFAKPEPAIRSRPTVFLDLDNTLICSLRLDSAESEMARNVNGFVPAVIFSDYEVYKRPHLDEFLSYLFENFRVGVWTAASKDYAAVITAELILRKYPNRRLEMFLSSDETRTAGEEVGGVKNLNALWDLWGADVIIERDDAIIIDDLPDVYITQPHRCIPVVAYHAQDADAPTDIGLKQLQKDLHDRYT